MNAAPVLSIVDIVHTVGWMLCHFVWEGALIGALAWVLMVLMRRSAPRVRYAVLSGCLALLLLAPAVTAAWLLSTGAPSVAGSMLPDPGQSGMTPAAGPWVTGSWRRAEAGLPYLVLLWLLGVTLQGVRRLGGLLLLRRLRRGAALVSASWQRKAAELGRHLGLHQAVPLLCSSQVDTAVVLGWLRPVILLPVSVVTGLAPEDLEAILVHELAHIGRHDHLINALQSLAEWLLFYHPAVWWVSAQLRLEREFCCDDQVISLGHRRAAYGRALARLEALRLPGAPVAVAATDGDLLRRIRRLARPTVARPAPSAGLTVGVLAGAALCASLVLSADPGGALGRGDGGDADERNALDAFAGELRLARRTGVLVHADGSWDLIVPSLASSDSSMRLTGSTLARLSNQLARAHAADTLQQVLLIAADSTVSSPAIAPIMDAARRAGFVDQIIMSDARTSGLLGVGVGASAERRGARGIVVPPYTVAYQVHQSAQVRAVLYDRFGSQVRVLRDERATPGTYRVEWDGFREDGSAAPPGVYYYKVSVGADQRVFKVVHRQ